MALTGPAIRPSDNPLVRLQDDLERQARQRRTGARFPPGDTSRANRRPVDFNRRPLTLLLEAYERYGPVFSLRMLKADILFALGPQANHEILVSQASNFLWREGFRDLIPLLGDGLLTIDGAFHRTSRKIMLPAFHRERIARALALMDDEIEAAVASWRPGVRLDLYDWTRHLALRIAMRALFGFDPDRSQGDLDAAAEFEHALGFYGHSYFGQMLRGPLTPWHRMRTARRRLDALIFGEIARRRRTGERGEDLLSLLLDAEDEDGNSLSDAHVRDEVMTLMFAGHDTTTATVCFLVYELARAPHELALLHAERRALGDGTPSFEQLAGGALPRLDMALDETLRLWPPAWIGPRRSVEATTVAGVHVPGDTFINYVSWASHRLPDVWEDPHAFVPDRFSEERRRQIPKGAYVPFGGGSRTCIGMRFGQLEIKAIMARILRDFDLALEPGWKLHVSQTPTLGPKGGLPVIVQAAA